jgi:poly-gamma-glutamate capsule biosynthesis protein CapA/YwtB (metallophosphatase superfamily)
MTGRRGYVGWVSRALVCLLVCGGVNSFAADSLPVFLSDNHAETFGWIARAVDVDRAHTLVLVDAHPDATCVAHSDELRDGLRRVVGEKERAVQIEDWRTTGRIQAFNWIEPLMPRPLERVIWVAAPVLSVGGRQSLQDRACGEIDGRMGFELRSAGSFARRWKTRDMADLKIWKPGGGRVILAVDLDFFADMAEGKREAAFEEIWTTAMDWPGLAGVAFSVSRPWLKDDAQADSLVRMALDAVRRTRGTRVELDVSIDDRPDDSLKGGGLRKRGKHITRWDAEKGSPALQALFVARRGEWKITDRKRDWEKILDRRAVGFSGVSLTADGGCPAADGVWRFPAGEVPVLRLHPPDGESATGRVRWHLLAAVRDAYDFLPETGLGKAFSMSPGRWIYGKKTTLALTTDFALAPEAWSAARNGFGRYCIGAEYETPSGWLPAGDMEFRLTEGTGFHAGLSECFRMPYAFGIALAQDHETRGVDPGWGSDCSNFLVHAWRRGGHRLPWGDPGRVSESLSCIAAHVGVSDKVPITPAQIRDGVAVDFGRHMAALWEDRPPLGVLDGGDLMAHHLGGVPEIVELGKLAATRPEFSVLVPKSGRTCRLAITGDMVLADVRESDMQSVREHFHGADLVLANLEGAPSPGPGDPSKRYDFRFPPERLDWLARAGVGVVSMANNHAADAGCGNLHAEMDAIRTVGLGVVGAGKDVAESLQPWRGMRNGVKLAVFGVCVVDAPVSGADIPGVARLPEHADALARAMAECKKRGEVVIVMIHWGDEYSRVVNDDQRQWARWLTECGASVVAGSHPHVTQGQDWNAGGVVLYSLGNAVYPRNLGTLGDGMVWRLTVDESGGIVECGHEDISGK